MPRYEVTLRFSGQRTSVHEAADEDEAIEYALDDWRETHVEAEVDRVVEVDAYGGGPVGQTERDSLARDSNGAASRDALIAEVEKRLAFNVRAYGTAWNGEREDTEFILAPLLDELTRGSVTR